MNKIKNRPALSASTVLKYAAITVIILCAVALIAYIVVSSFKPLNEVMTKAKFFPENPTFDNYIRLFTSESSNKDFGRYLINSLIVSAGAAAMTCVVSCLAAYGFSRFQYVGKKLMLNSLLFIYVFPTIILLVPLYKLYSQIGLVDNFFALMLTYTGLAAPFCTWILVSFFDSVPKSLEEAGQVDGARPFTIFTKILMPVITPGLITVLAYSFITSWGEYVFASILMRSNENRTITQALVDFTSDQYIEWGLLLAGSVVVIIPVMALFIPVAKNFIKGFTAGAVKE